MRGVSADPPSAQVPAVSTFLARHGRILWWLHSLYALALGVSVVIFADRGFAHARFLSISLAVVWIVLIVFFRLYGSGSSQRERVTGRHAKLRFYVMTYVLKNLYQGMLFFLLPFYWRTATLDAPTQWFVLILGVCAVLSTLDVVFDHVLMRFKLAASLFYFFTLFCCLNLVIPAMFPNQRALGSLVAAALIAALGFWTMHIPVRFLSRPIGVVLLVTWAVGSLAGAYYGRHAVPPVAMHVVGGAVGPQLLPDGRLAFEASKVHTSLIDTELYAVTEVSIPGGRGDHLAHVWRKDDGVVMQTMDTVIETSPTPGRVLLRSMLPRGSAPKDTAGQWSVDVTTADGQLVGRVHFEVTE